MSEQEDRRKERMNKRLKRGEEKTTIKDRTEGRQKVKGGGEDGREDDVWLSSDNQRTQTPTGRSAYLSSPRRRICAD